MTDTEKALSVISPKMELSDFKGEVTSLKEFVSKGMHDNYDYGIHPGTRNKVLKAPGAEKLAKRFGLVPKYVLIKEMEDFSKNFFFYKYKCELYDFRSGTFAGEAIRSANSNEPSMRNAPANTVDARAQKRALLAAVRLATMASEIFYDGGDDDENTTAPNKPSTVTENPERVNLFKRFFASATERGFTQEFVKSALHKKYNVDSMDKLSNAQISDALEKLVTTFKVVAKGQRPEYINVPEGKKKEESTAPAGQEGSADIEQGSIVDDEMKKCYSCGKMNKEDWFCNKDCKDAYWKKTDPKMYEQMKRNEKLQTVIS